MFVGEDTDPLARLFVRCSLLGSLTCRPLWWTKQILRRATLLWYGFVQIYSVTTLTSARSLEMVRMHGKMMNSLKEANPHNVVTNNSHSLVVALVLRSFLKLFLRVHLFSGNSTRITTLGISWVHHNLFGQTAWRFVISPVSLHHRALHARIHCLLNLHLHRRIQSYPAEFIHLDVSSQLTIVVAFIYNNPLFNPPKRWQTILNRFISSVHTL